MERCGGWEKSGNGLQGLMEVEDGHGRKRFRVRDKNFVRRQGARGLIEPKHGSRFAVFGSWFHGVRRSEGGERSRI